MSPPSYSRHRKRYEGEGHARYLTFSCFQNQSLLTPENARLWLVEAIAQAKAKQPFDLWAWVAMPEHVHLLLWPQKEVKVGAILQSIKQSVTLRAIHFAQTQQPDLLAAMRDLQPNGELAYRFWQRGGGHDRNIFSVAEVHEKINYIHANPVRRGMVDHPQDWRWSSWSAWHGEGTPIHPVDRESLPHLVR